MANEPKATAFRTRILNRDLRNHVLVPDLAGWRRERLPKYPGGAFVTLAPDWVCEVLSPRTHRLDRIDKKAADAREGVQYPWFVDPLERMLETFELEVPTNA